METMPTWVVLESCKKIPDGVTAFRKKRRSIAVHKQGGEVRQVFQNNCPHNPRIKITDDFTLEDETITCRFHGACWKLEDGEIMKGPGRKDLHLFEFRINEKSQLEVLID